MPRTWIEHTAELELRIDASSEAAVFVEALQALAELLDDGREGDDVTCGVEIRAPDRAALLARWLDELVFLAESDDFIPHTVIDASLEPGRFVAKVGGHRGDPRHLVKGVTYHRLAFESCADGWRATVVLDV